MYHTMPFHPCKPLFCTKEIEILHIFPALLSNTRGRGHSDAPSPEDFAFLRSQDMRDDGFGAHAEEEHETQQHIVALPRLFPVLLFVHSGTSSVSDTGIQ